ncbi:MAG: DUF4340 domain-containing protein [Candidatus Binatia bacterium]
MSWRRVAVIYAVLAALAGWVFVVDGGAPDPEIPAAVAPAPSLLDTAASAVTALTFRKEGTVVRAQRLEQRWTVIEPAGVKIPPDLFDATVATLTTGQPAEELSQEPASAYAAYGLATPGTTLEVSFGEAAPPILVSLGDENPTRTAVYARRSDRPAIFLVGLNLRYYIDLVFGAAKP